MNENELLDALRDAIHYAPAGADVMTLTELIVLLGANPRYPRPVREAVRSLIQAGKWECVKVARIRMDGSPMRIAGYRLKI